MTKKLAGPFSNAELKMAKGRGSDLIASLLLFDGHVMVEKGQKTWTVTITGEPAMEAIISRDVPPEPADPIWPEETKPEVV